MKVLTLTINQFNTFVKNILDAEEFLHGVGLMGEVTNFKLSGGNAWFDLKDESAMVSCVKFGANDINIKNGDYVTVFGKVNYYVKSGRLNFIAAKVEQSGIGNLWQKFLELKDKLGKEGFFDEDIKKTIPKFAKKIGVVTSETGAVIRDIINVTRSKNPYTDIVVYPSKVQGVAAEDELCEGIKYFNSRNDIDTIIVARGGGSLEDLAPFNTEKIVKEIYASRIPVISAVGHETDFTLCDFAADLRVPTPSVAAEVAVFNYFEQVENIKAQVKIIDKFIEAKVQNAKENLIINANSIIDKVKLKLNISENLLLTKTQEIYQSVCRTLQSKQNKVDVVSGVISKLNPLEVLKNGYSVIEKNGKKISKIEDVSVGDNLNLFVSNGRINVKVEKTDKVGD
ncbi:MAG: exodeoxyribonuclease VII large subunit [Clostridia bacterium]|nr:exodeoxyribonuclease VII large subunit [Clostridia bacterium]